MKVNSYQKGFTIVELLIVIVVIGILAAIIIVTYNGIATHARDTRRLDELVGLGKVLEIYHAENGGYPRCDTTTGPNISYTPITGTVSSCLADELVPAYITTLPTDPTNNGSNVYFYAAGYEKTDTTSFTNNSSDNFILGVKEEASTGPYYTNWGKSDLTLLIGS